jgi:hypothetical protein
VGQIARVSHPLLAAMRNGLLKRVSPTMQARQIARMINGGINGG